MSAFPRFVPLAFCPPMEESPLPPPPLSQGQRGRTGKSLPLGERTGRRSPGTDRKGVPRGRTGKEFPWGRTGKEFPWGRTGKEFPGDGQDNRRIAALLSSPLRDEPKGFPVFPLAVLPHRGTRRAFCPL